MWVLVTYDVNTETSAGRRRLRRVAKICEGYGTRVQKSVFECRLSANNYEIMKQRLVKSIVSTDDSLRIYRLQDKKSHVLETFGVDNAIDFTETLVI